MAGTGFSQGQATAAVLWSSMGLTVALKGLVDALLWHVTAYRIVEQELGVRRERESRRTGSFVGGDKGGVRLFHVEVEGR